MQQGLLYIKRQSYTFYNDGNGKIGASSYSAVPRSCALNSGTVRPSLRSPRARQSSCSSALRIFQMPGIFPFGELLGAAVLESSPHGAATGKDDSCTSSAASSLPEWFSTKSCSTCSSSVTAPAAASAASNEAVSEDRAASAASAGRTNTGRQS